MIVTALRIHTTGAGAYVNGAVIPVDGGMHIWDRMMMQQTRSMKKSLLLFSKLSYKHTSYKRFFYLYKERMRLGQENLVFLLILSKFSYKCTQLY